MTPDTTPAEIAALCQLIDHNIQWGGLQDVDREAYQAARDLVSAIAAERDRLAARLEKAESDCAMFADANARQAMCISFTASNLGPEYSATIEGLPKSARHISAERDRLADENERLRAALDDVLQAHESGWIAGEDWGAAERARAALKGETP